jgi:hypothetical protein
MMPIEGIFSSPEKSPIKEQAHAASSSPAKGEADRTLTTSEDMEIQNSMLT